MTDIAWHLLQPVDIGGAFQQGMQRGKAMRRESVTQNALAAFVADPTSTEPISALASVDPALALQVQEQQRGRAKEVRREQIYSQYAGDPRGGQQAAMAAGETDLAAQFAKLGDADRERVKESTKILGQAALDVSRRPEAERAAAWATYVQNAEASGFDIPPQYERYSPDALNSASAEAGTMEKLIKQFEPDWSAVAPGGYMVDRNPLTNPGRAGFGGSPEGQGAAPVTDKAQYDALPPGASYTAPDGSQRIKGGAPSQGGATFP